VMAIPFSLLALAFGLQVALEGPADGRRGPAALELGLAAIALGSLYAINAWSFPVIAGLVLLCALVRVRSAPSVRERMRGLVWGIAALLLAVLAVLPFLLTYDAAADGLGRVTERASFGSWTRDHAALYGLLAFLVATAYGIRLASSRHPWRTAAWAGAAAVFVGSLLAADNLTAVAGLLALCWVAAHAAFVRRAPAVERFVWVLIGGGLLCLLIPEVVYVRDSFAGSALYRMNTVFKLGYQAYLLLAIAAACALPWAGRWLPRRAWTGWAGVTAVLVLLGLVFPYAANWARRDGFSRSPTLDGLGWLRASAPGDVGAIEWLRANAPGDAVLLEAAGPDYSGFGHGRIILRHMLPNVMAPYLIMLTAFLGQAILLESSLSFLGLGVQEPIAAWGLMLRGAAVEFAEAAPWMAVFPGLAISLSVFAFNLFGDSLRDALDPRLKTQ